MLNPYDSPTHSQHLAAPPRKARVWVILAFLLFFIAAFISLPALLILNQELDILPLTFGITGIESGGESLSQHSVMLFLFCFASAILFFATACVFVAWYNVRLNRSRFSCPSNARS